MALEWPALTRPRVEGDREAEFLDATIALLGEVGYDRLTMDAVAKRAKASKATLYRRWDGKLGLVIDALKNLKQVPTQDPDTGSLRGDLIEAFAHHGGLLDERSLAAMVGVLAAVTRDPEFAEAFRVEVLGPKRALSHRLWTRARDRGELRADADLDLLESALAGIVLHRVYLLGDPRTSELIVRILDTVVLPAALADPPPVGTGPSG